ncbi:MAG: GDP-L-fucose synthase [Patescibacteria group bacterium]|nr:GDP-L-fucose synthase [Patescibacteria group bacterium]
MKKDSLIFVAGHNGMVGGAIVRNLKSKGFSNILTAPRKNLDLLNQASVMEFFEKNKPEYVFLAAAKVGGIVGNNTKRADFIYENLTIETNIIHASHVFKAKKLLFLGSSCIYPKMAPQPMTEDVLLTSPLEPTNEPYAIAKIAGLKMCDAYRDQYGDNFISVMPTNLYGSGDNYHLQNSHVLPALIRKFHQAKEDNLPTVTIWGTGTPKREFLHVDDLADACVFLMENYDEKGWVNIGTGTDIAIKDLAELVKNVVGFTGDIILDTTKPDGPPRKLLNCDKLHALGWQHTIELEQGLDRTYQAFLKELKEGTLREI